MNPLDSLFTQSTSSNVAPETLEMLGHQASQLFQTQGLPLNKAISQILSNHPELENEHVRRIVEFANTVTFQNLFQNSPDKNVHFEVADPGVILRDLKDGGSSEHAGRTLNFDYQRIPPTSQDQELDASLMQQFSGSSTPISEATKVASVNHELHANPIEDVYDTMLRLQATRDKLAESYETIHNLMRGAQEDFYREVEIQIMDPEGAGLGGVLGALEKIASEDLVETIMIPITERLIEDGYGKERLTKSMTKTAGEVSDLTHPLFGTFDAIIKTAEELVNCGQAIYEVDVMLEQIKVPFKKIAGALTTNVKNTLGIPGHVPAGIRQRFPRNT